MAPVSAGGAAGLLLASSPAAVAASGVEVRLNARQAGDCYRAMNALTPREDVWQGKVRDQFSVATSREAEAVARIAKALNDGGTAIAQYAKVLEREKANVTAAMKLAAAALQTYQAAASFIGPLTPVAEAARKSQTALATTAYQRAMQSIDAADAAVAAAAAALQAALRGSAAAMKDTPSVGDYTHRQASAVLGLKQWSNGRLTDDGEPVSPATAGAGGGSVPERGTDDQEDGVSLDYYQFKVAETEIEAPVGEVFEVGVVGEVGGYVSKRILPEPKSFADAGEVGGILGTAFTVGTHGASAAAGVLGERATSIDPRHAGQHDHSMGFVELSVGHESVGVLYDFENELTIYKAHEVGTTQIMPGTPVPDVSIHVGDGITVTIPHLGDALDAVGRAASD